jgi:hypothetical protein
MSFVQAQAALTWGRMTSQATERIFWRGLEYRIIGYPLEPLFEAHPRPKFAEPSTGLERGYLGVWEVRSDRLGLTDLLHATVDGASGLACVFPEATPPVSADWFSGEIFLDVPRSMEPEERETKGYPRAGFPVLTFARGQLVAQRMATCAQYMDAWNRRESG